MKNVSPATTAAIADAYLTWINEQLRHELESRRNHETHHSTTAEDRRAILHSYLFAGLSMLSFLLLNTIE